MMDTLSLMDISIFFRRLQYLANIVVDLTNGGCASRFVVIVCATLKVRAVFARGLAAIDRNCKDDDA